MAKQDNFKSMKIADWHNQLPLELRADGLEVLFSSLEKKEMKVTVIYELLRIVSGEMKKDPIEVGSTERSRLLAFFRRAPMATIGMLTAIHPGGAVELRSRLRIFFKDDYLDLLKKIPL